VLPSRLVVHRKTGSKITAVSSQTLQDHLEKSEVMFHSRRYVYIKNQRLHQLQADHQSSHKGYLCSSFRITFFYTISYSLYHASDVFSGIEIGIPFSF